MASRLLPLNRHLLHRSVDLTSVEIPNSNSHGVSHDDKPRRRWLALFGFLCVLLIWPTLAILRTPADPLDFAWQIESDRLGAYTASMIFLWAMFAVVVVFQLIERRRISELGFGAPRAKDFLYGILFLLAAYPLLASLALGLESIGLAIPEMVIKALLPVTTVERTVWIALSTTAAVCEETVFRGYLLVNGEAILKSRTLAVALSVATFGIGHYYQGWGGVILISFYGLLFTWLRYRTGSLWACIVAHAVQDIISGFLGSLQNV